MGFVFDRYAEAVAGGRVKAGKCQRSYGTTFSWYKCNTLATHLMAGVDRIEE